MNSIVIILIIVAAAVAAAKPLSISMFQGDTWDYDGLDGSFDNLGDIHQEETSEHLHPAIVAAIALGCVSGALAIITWILTTCGSCIRIRRRNRDEEANEPSYRSTTLESQSTDYIRTLTTLTPHGSSVEDTPESVPLSTRVVRRPGPNGNVNRVAAEEKHNGQRLTVTLSNMPVDLLGPLAFILSCISIMRHCPRTPKSCQQRTGPFAEPDTSTARQPWGVPYTANMDQDEWYFLGTDTRRNQSESKGTSQEDGKGVMDDSDIGSAFFV
ncbi:hypothetical protein LZ31DRAFT_590712 [Colletotrichum somersetense]|nr:hypothetical protein LZ31DRAFT_590712 [Colletotrichum somersetense]